MDGWPGSARLVERVRLATDSIAIELNRPALTQRLLGEPVEDDPIVLDVAISIARRGVESRLVVESPGAKSARSADVALVRGIACGRAWFEELSTGKASSFTEIAERVGVTDRYVSRMVGLAFLAPDVVEVILAGEHRPDVTVKSLTVDGSVAIRWEEQRGLVIGGRGT